MTHPVRFVGLAAFLALVSAFAAVPQASAATSATAANVYIQVQGPAGAVYAFHVSSTGQVTAISGSPFKPAGLIIGATASRFFTLGKTLIHSYGLASGGAIQSQLGQIGYFNYPGSSCGGGESSAVLDHTGKYIYVLLQGGGSGTCAAYQSYAINSNGTFTFNGDTEESLTSGGGADNPSILGNETFAYADSFYSHDNTVIGFRRESSGTLALMPFNETDPTLDGGPNYTPYQPDASPAGNYLVLGLLPYDTNPPKLGSYTVDAQGNISSTNTSSNMPTSPFDGFASTFSPAGDLFAIYADNGTQTWLGNGIEIYKFNGAEPLTPYQTLLNGTPIDQVLWDSSNHMYAISKANNRLYVFSVTSTSITQEASWSISSPFRMVVVSAATSVSGCTTGNDITVCQPQQNQTVSSPFQVQATTTLGSPTWRFELWDANSGTKLVSVDNSNTMNATVSLPSGQHRLAFVARLADGTRRELDVSVSVK